MHTDWHPLQPAPKKWFSKPIRINDNAFIVAAEKMTAVGNDEDDGVFVYNVLTDQWSLFFRYPDDAELFIEYPTMCWDKAKDALFIHSDGNTLLIIDVRTKAYWVKHPLGFLAGSYANCITLGNTFHLIGGYLSNQHVQWRDVRGNHEDFEMLQSLEGFGYSGCEGAGFVHSTSRNLLLLFGGYDKHRDYSVDTEPCQVLCCRCDGDVAGEWTPYKDLRMPNNLRQFGFAQTCDERFVLMVGGRCLENEQYEDAVYVMDVDRGVLEKSALRTPKASVFHCIAMPRPPNDELLISGYLAESGLPKDIHDMIASWYSCESLHVLKDEDHWKVNLNHLIHNL